jgi:hypothetical protein
MSKASVKRAQRIGKRRSPLRRPLAAVAIGSLGVIGLGAPSVPTGATGVAAPKHFEGTFSAEGTPTFNDPKCSNLAGTNFSEVYQYAYDFPEQDWTSTSKTCATIIGDRYSAVGTFTITRPGGTLTGVYATSNLVPVPHDYEGVLHITGGTGLYEDASGSCVQTNWVANGFSLSGTVTCDISPK